MAHSAENTFSSARSVHELIAVRAAGEPDATAIAAPERAPLTYGQLGAHVEAVIERLNAIGVGRGDRVAIVLPNGPELATAFLSVAAAASSAPLNPDYRAQEFDFYLSDLDAQALIVKVGDDSPAVDVARARGIPVLRLRPLEDAEAGRFVLEGEARERTIRSGPAGPEDEALVLHTSGTTARPKIVPLTHANLCTSAGNIGRTLALTPADRCLNVMPLFHIHGLMAATLSTLAAGAEVVCTPGFYAPQFFGWMQAHRPTWYTAVPTMHQAILARAGDHPEVVAQNRLRFVRSSSSSLPPQVMEELETVFGAPVIEAYGMTEASHQMASNPLPPRERKPGSVGPAAGPDVAIMDEAGKLLPPGETGEIVIRGASVTGGYESNPEANARAFTDGWFRTGDEGRMDEDDYLFITGRIKEIINRGGEKISPREIDEVLLDHPGVAQAVAFAVPDPRLGEAVAAAVVRRAEASVTGRQLRTFAAARLAPFKVPREMLFVDEIPKGPTGKVQRVSLAEQLGVTAPERAREKRPFAAPRTPVEEVLAGLWADVLDLDQVSVHDHFMDLGGDSMLAARLVGRVQGDLQLELSLVDFFDAPTIADQASIVEELLLSAPDTAG